MAEITYLSPLNGEIAHAVMDVINERSAEDTGVVNGNKVTESTPNSMILHIDAGRIRVSGAPLDVNADTVTIDAADVTNPRIDVIYRRASDGDCLVHKGTAAAITDEGSLGNWHQYSTPAPNDSVPAGAILALVYVGAGETTIANASIWMMGGKVNDIKTTAASPGSDSYPLSEKACQSTYAPAARGVTNGDSHDHDGGDGAQVNHTKLSNIGTNTHSQIDSHIGSTANPHTVTAAQAGADITTGTAHAATSKDTPADLDEIPVLDSEATFGLKKFTWSTIKTKLKTYLDGYYPLKAVVTAAGDLVYGSAAGTWAALAKSTDGYRLALVSGLPAWIVGTFDAAYVFGDASAVIVAHSLSFEFPLACQIVRARIRSQDANADLLSGSVTATFYVHDYNVDADSVASSGDIALSTASTKSEAENITVAADKMVTVRLSGITACKQVIVSLKFEAT